VTSVLTTVRSPRRGGPAAVADAERAVRLPRRLRSSAALWARHLGLLRRPIPRESGGESEAAHQGVVGIHRGSGAAQPRVPPATIGRDGERGRQPPVAAWI